MSRSAVLRERLAGGESVVMPGVWDPWSALLAQQAGFHTVFLSGFALAGTHLGVPDIGILNQSDMADAARRVCAAVPDMSVVVDADTGYGGREEVRRTVELWEEAGATALFLEDQVWPKKCGHMDGKEVVPVEEWIGKLQTVIEVRTDLFLTARTDAVAVTGLEDAIDRARRARDIGVDAVFVEAPRSISELEKIARSLPDVTLVANMVETGKTPLLTPDELAQLGFTLIVSPLSGLLWATQALSQGYRQLQEHGSLRDLGRSHASFDEFTDLVGLANYRARDAQDR